MPEIPSDLVRVDISGLALGEKLGKGASGEVLKGEHLMSFIAGEVLQPSCSLQEAASLFQHSMQYLRA